MSVCVFADGDFAAVGPSCPLYLRGCTSNQRVKQSKLIPQIPLKRHNQEKQDTVMLPPPSLTIIQMQMQESAADVQDVPCTCGAKDFKLKRKQMKNLAKEDTTEAKQVASGTDSPKLHRSLWRKLLGQGPKCVCPKQRSSSNSGLIEIPHEYVGCTAVTVAGKRVPFSRDMQQQYRKSWTPLDAIDEDE